MELSNLYEAAYYIMYGAKIEQVYIKKLPENKAKRIGRQKLWVVVLKGIPSFAKETWDSGYTFGNIREYARIRAKLKRQLENKLKL